jgi:hypothetical protein
MTLQLEQPHGRDNRLAARGVDHDIRDRGGRDASCAASGLSAAASASTMPVSTATMPRRVRGRTGRFWYEKRGP